MSHMVFPAGEVSDVRVLWRTDGSESLVEISLTCAGIRHTFGPFNAAGDCHRTVDLRMHSDDDES